MKILRTHCEHGHAYAEHAYVSPTTGIRCCRICRRARKRAWVRGRKRKARTHCRRGHAYAEHAVRTRGTWRCMRCASDLKRARLLERRPELRVAGRTPQSVAATINWQQRRAHFGPTGMTALGLANLAGKLRARIALHGHPSATKTACINGHPYTAATMKRDNRGARVCLECVKAGRFARRHPPIVSPAFLGSVVGSVFNFAALK